jgi:hypothetical protein
MSDSGDFGLCPHCHKTDGYMNVGRDHWYYCSEHRTKWWIGANLFSVFEEDEEEDRAWFKDNDFGSWQVVEPFFPDRYKPRARRIPAQRE